MEGIVIKSTGSFYEVLSPEGEKVNCKIRGKFRLDDIKTTNPVAVGDRVIYTFSEKEKVSVITEILPRKNYIIRKSANLSKQAHIIASNIDHAYLVASLVLPRTSTGFMDRFLVTAEAFHIPASIIFSKADYYNEEVMNLYKDLKGLYENLGYTTFLVSAYNEKDILQLKELMKDKINLFAGHSGVGKSTLINAIQPGLNLKTAPISEQHFKGKHTTTFAEMHLLNSGGFIIDTPGIKEFGMYDFSKEEIAHAFPEFRERMQDCQFNNCLHINEPRCAVKDAVENGEIHQSRYYNYLGLISGEDLYE